MTRIPPAGSGVPPGRDATTRDAVSAGGGPLLEVEGLSTTFRTAVGDVRAVDGVSLSLDGGRTLGIVGESGCGKSVLVRSIMGLSGTRDVERRGRVAFDGADLLGLGPSALRRYWGKEMAMVFQDPMTSLNPVMRIAPQITESLRHHRGLARGEALRAALDLLRAVGIPEPARRLRQYPHQLSGGMRQRVTIAIALAGEPRLLLADEPTTALDVTVQAQILDLLARQQEERRMAMMLVSHDLSVVAGRTDEIAVMYAGQIVERAPTRALFRQVRMPYTEALLRSIPRLDQPSHTPLHVIGGRPPSPCDTPRGCRFAPRCPSVQDRCREEPPPLVEVVAGGAGTGHHYRCWFPVGTPQGRDALARNLRSGLPQAQVAMTGDAAKAGSLEQVP